MCIRDSSCSVPLTDISHSFSLLSPLFPFTLFYSPYEWDHVMFVLLRLPYFTQHNTLQLHPCWSRWWVFIVSNCWVICGICPQWSITQPWDFIYFWGSERASTSRGCCGGRGKRKRVRIWSRLCAEPGAALDLITLIITWVKTKSQMLNGLSHSVAPK